MPTTNITTLNGSDVNAAISALNNPTKSLSATGYLFLPGGGVVQWGTVSIGATSGSTATLTFPIAFPTTVHSLTFTPNFSVNGTSSIYVTAKTNTNASLQRSNNGNADAGTVFFWFAIGS